MSADIPTPSADGRRRRERSRPRGTRPRRRFSVVGALGELFITAGVIVLLFIGWEVGWQSIVTAHQQTSAAAEQSQKFLHDAQKKSAPTPTPQPSAAAPSIPVTATVANFQPFAVIYIPRLGNTWKRVIRETVDENQVLNSYVSGVGHYSGTAMPGQVGNFAIAGHDTGYGNAFIGLANLQLGDAIYVQTANGWYTYTFRNYQYVQPNQTQVLDPVPGQSGVTPTERLMTITTCNPPWAARERLIAYSDFSSFQPLSSGPPSAIAAEVNAQGGA